MLLLTSDILQTDALVNWIIMGLYNGLLPTQYQAYNWIIISKADGTLFFGHSFSGKPNGSVEKMP